jgi:hypothetical protein
MARERQRYGELRERERGGGGVIFTNLHRRERER